MRNGPNAFSLYIPGSPPKNFGVDSWKGANHSPSEGLPPPPASSLASCPCCPCCLFCPCSWAIALREWLQENAYLFFECFPYVCPEIVLVK